MLVPSVVVTDMRLRGDISGSDVCRHFRKLRVPVVVLTGVSREDVDPWTRTEGCDLLLTKPVAPDTLAETIDQLIAPSGNRQ